MSKAAKVARLNAKGMGLCNKLCRRARKKMKRYGSKAARKS